jgi:hypothetical protein
LGNEACCLFVLSFDFLNPLPLSHIGYQVYLNWQNVRKIEIRIDDKDWVIFQSNVAKKNQKTLMPF